MAFEKQMRTIYGYDIWMDWEKPRLGTTIAVFEGPDNVQILYWADPSELTKEEVLAETKALYPGRTVTFHDKIDEHQVMVPRIIQEGGGIVKEQEMGQGGYGRRELVIIGGGMYCSYRPFGRGQAVTRGARHSVPIFRQNLKDGGYEQTDLVEYDLVEIVEENREEAGDDCINKYKAIILGAFVISNKAGGLIETTFNSDSIKPREVKGKPMLDRTRNGKPLKHWRR